MANGSNQGQGLNGQSSLYQRAVNFVRTKIIEIIGVAILAGIGWAVHDLPDSVSELDKKVSVIESEMETLKGNYTTLNSQIWSINKADSDNREKSGPEYVVQEPEILIASENFSYAMISAQASIGSSNNKIFADLQKFQNEDEIGISIISGESKTKKSLEESLIIMQYKEGDEDVFFCGKYNESGQWDGKCIINRYRESKLTYVLEAMYDNGELKSYQNIFKRKNLQGQDTWYVSNRVVEDEGNRGETITYFFYGDYEKNFDDKTMKKEDILSVEDFVNTIPSNIEGYYNGYTSDGKYNDESGEAYLIKYKPDGTVRFLYKGNIKNGYPHDETGNAWFISWGNADDGYYYYKGIFKNGKHGKSPKGWKPMTQDEIKEKVNPNDFKYPLTGLIDSDL